ncbi:hypothetical protein H310_08242 [Aphanomyces invadans]|uniref:Serine/threonine-protein phosphatase n=1 Tax=Aphanomyces invadans TaxID=157072 RepID=A0A024U035_9STRA|nr:hypothetical protein H310_08242 [Aphanomyces invadans]ETV99589.1 hypothetical protein H310_08242 [Aphanomyces invadans]|eukprot:XP_008872145.1 hypothetical protein H310_08242 [Aphanomyces invadans]
MSVVSRIASCCFGESIFSTSILAEGPLIKKGDYAHFRYFVLEASGLLKYYEITLRQTINACGDIVYHIPSIKLTQTSQLSNRNLRGTMMLHPSFCAKDIESPQAASNLNGTRDFRSNSFAGATPGPSSEMRCFRKSKEILVSGFGPTGNVVSWKLQATTLEHYERWTRALRIAMRPAWALNAPFCQVCHMSFHWFNRPHHCRKCGSSVCAACSHAIDKLPLLAYTSPVLVCIDCDPIPEDFAPQTKVLVYGKHPAMIVVSKDTAKPFLSHQLTSHPSAMSLAVQYLSDPATTPPTLVSVKYVERFSEKVLAANRIKCCLRMHLAYRLFRALLHFHTWTLLESLQEQQTVKIVKIIRNTISVNELASLAPSYEERTDVSSNLHNSLKHYRGVHLSFPLTENQVLKLSDAFRSGQVLHGHYVMQLVQEVLDRPPQATMTHIQIPKGVELVIVGDLHGQYEDLMTIFDRKGVPSKTLWYLFNGDFVDRGLHGVEVICTLLAYSLLYPHFVFLNRGNHEALVLNQVFGFADEVAKKYNTTDEYPLLFDKFEAVFNRLPLCTLIQDSVFVVHGGLPIEPNVTLNDIEAIDHLREIPTSRLDCLEDEIFSQLMWNDPQPRDGYG